MKSLEARFKRMAGKYPNNSSLINFGRAIWGQKMSRQVINKWFNKLVDKTDYDREDRKVLINHLSLVTNLAEEDCF